MTTETIGMYPSLDVYCEKKPKTCGQCGYFNRYSQPCKIDYYSSAKTKACSQAIARKDLKRVDY